MALGVGDGTFTASQQIDLTTEPFALVQEINNQWSDIFATGDLNGDGITDQVTDNGINSLVISLGNNPPSVLSLYPFSDRASAIVIADMNSDGNLDVIVRVVNSSDLLIYLGDGTGQLLAPFSVVSVNTHKQLKANDILIADFDENGWKDFAITDWIFEEDSRLWAMLQLPRNASDLIAPPVAITSFIDGQNISNTVAVTAIANDDFGVTRVDFLKNHGTTW